MIKVINHGLITRYICIQESQGFLFDDLAVGDVVEDKDGSIYIVILDAGSCPCKRLVRLGTFTLVPSHLIDKKRFYKLDTELIINGPCDESVEMAIEETEL